MFWVSVWGFFSNASNKALRSYTKKLLKWYNVFMRYFISKASALIRRRQLKAIRAIYSKKRSQTDRPNNCHGGLHHGTGVSVIVPLSLPFLLCQALCPKVWPSHHQGPLALWALAESPLGGPSRSLGPREVTDVERLHHLCSQPLLYSHLIRLSLESQVHFTSEALSDTYRPPHPCSLLFQF